MFVVEIVADVTFATTVVVMSFSEIDAPMPAAAAPPFPPAPARLTPPESESITGVPSARTVTSPAVVVSCAADLTSALLINSIVL